MKKLLLILTILFSIVFNVIVQENDEGKVEVSAVDPMASMQAVENSDLKNIATEIRAKLKNVINNL